MSALSPRAAAQVATLLLAAAQASARATRVLESGCRECAHLDVVHDLDRKGRRRACSTSSGPDATPCACTAFEPILEPGATS